MNWVLILIGIALAVLFIAPYFTNHIMNIGSVTGLVIAALLAIGGIREDRIAAGFRSAWGTGGGRVGLTILLIALAALFFLVMMETGCILFGVYGLRPPKDERYVPQTLILLGCKIRTEASRQRVSEAERWLRSHPDAICIVSGGQGDDEDMTEAEFMKNELSDRGIDWKRLPMERSSASTWENLRNSRKVLASLNRDMNVILVSSGYHLYRASYMAGKLGYNCCALPAKSVWWALPTFYIRELYAITWMWMHRGSLAV